jgi:type II secretory pathway component PulF
MKIYDYRYRAKRLRDGKVVKGMTEAPSKAMVEKFLVEQSLKPIEVYQQKSVFQALNRITFGSVMKERDLIFYLKQLSSLLNAGIKLNEASEMLATQQTNKAVRRILYGIYYEVNSGQTLAEAYKEYPNEFPNILVSMVQVGERTGDLKTAIREIVDYFESQYRLKTSIQSTLMMPVIYLVVAFLVAIFLFTFVMPQFESMFSAGVDGVEMPAVTRLFINIGNIIRSNALMLIIGALAFIGGFAVLMKRSKSFQKFVAYVSIKMPIIGQIVILNNLSRIAATLSQMLNNHVPLQDSLATTYDTLNNRIYKELIIQAQKNVTAGDYMSMAFEGHYAVEVVFTRMVSVGERTGELGQMLENLSNFYDEDSDVKIERLKKSLEPVLLIFIFALIVVMLLAVMMPSLSFASQI